MGSFAGFEAAFEGEGAFQKVAPFAVSHEVALQWVGNPVKAGFGVAAVFSSSSANRQPERTMREMMATEKKFILRLPMNWRPIIYENYNNCQYYNSTFADFLESGSNSVSINSRVHSRSA